MDLEASNFTELKRRHGVAPGTLLLEDSVAAGPVKLVVVCSQITSQTVQLQAGYVSAGLLQFNPGSDPWSGAVAGVRITANN